MANELSGHKVAVLATDGFEQSELEEPVRALREAGAEVEVVAPSPGTIQGWRHHEKGDTVPVDRTLDEIQPNRYDALVLPGGVINPDALRLQPKAIDFVHHFVEAGKPIGAICHGPWTLIDAEGVSGRRMTSWPSLKTDLTNAGAHAGHPSQGLRGQHHRARGSSRGTVLQLSLHAPWLAAGIAAIGTAMAAPFLLLSL